MNDSPLSPAGRRPRLLRKCGVAAAAALVLLASAPLVATVWTRANVQVRIPKGGRAALEDVSYSGRDWSIALTAVEVREEGRPSSGLVSLVWTFHYTNTDREPHHAAITIRCLDVKRGERARLAAILVLQPDAKTEETVEIRAKVNEAAWLASSYGRIVVDFLSGPEG